MLDVVGLIRPNITGERARMHRACTASLSFIDGHTYNVKGENTDDFGKRFIELMDRGENDYVMFYIEDALMVLDNGDVLKRLIEAMKISGAEVMKASFHQIELNSIKNITPCYEDEYSFVYDNTPENHKKYCEYYGSRYYLGLNGIFEKNFLRRLLQRTKSYRPHEMELPHYDKNFAHKVLVPKVEVLASIDDGHGLEGSQLLKRNDTKFWNLYNNV